MRNTTRPLVPRSLLTALAALAAPLWPLPVIIRLVADAMRRSD